MKRKVTSIMLVLIIGIVFFTNSNESDAKANVSKVSIETNRSNNKVENAIITAVYDICGKYYDIYDIEIDSSCDESFFVCADVVLKYGSVNEEPYFKGMMDVLHLDSGKQKWNSYEEVYDAVARMAYIDDVDISGYEDSVAFMVWTEYDNLRSFIGQHQNLNMYMRIEYNESDYPQVMIENLDDYVSVDKFKLKDESEQYEWGYDTMLSECKEIVDNKMSYAATTSSEQRRSYAISYMTTYTSNPSNSSTCSYCGSYSCGGKQRIGYYNLSTYSTWYGHNDCANYASQALYASGAFSQDSSWYTYSNAWIGSISLKNYLVASGKITSVTSSNFYTGDLAYISGYGHVMMVTQKDGVAPKISAHSHDRLNKLFDPSIYNTYSYWRVHY